MSLLRFLGLGGPTAGRDQEAESLALLTGRLDSLPEEDARLAAASELHTLGSGLHTLGSQAEKTRDARKKTPARPASDGRARRCCAEIFIWQALERPHAAPRRMRFHGDGSSGS